MADVTRWAIAGTFIAIAVILLMLSFVSAETITYQQGEIVDLKYPCINNGTYCSGTAACNITIFDPSNAVVVNNKAMTNLGAWHNYTLTALQTAMIGTYQDSMICTDGGLNGYSTFSHDITRTGEATKGFDVLPLIMAFIAALVILMTMAIVSGKNHPVLGVGLSVITIFLINPMIQLATLFMADNFRSEILKDNINAIQGIVTFLSYVIIVYIIVYILIQVISNYNSAKAARLDGIN